ncbi:ATP-grasp domain-containing protein [Lacicoccus qingdaonensis]|uniref:Cyanophycin synthetase n=1 Tax=Lacicoccus qingdaonensis TaxID=576118 RepID=A0A1G9IKB0_9BACL|nr:ATP-grasp domain-containing protein [Salinicoccus qingdaonensis]SDL25353.1 cyanophycin synthetase [Salinicoccus qingdaonensis]
MNDNDLKYLLNNNPYSEKNYYPMNVTSATAAFHTEFLKRSHFKYKIRNTKRKYLKIIDVLRSDGSLIGSIKNPIYPTNAYIGRQITIDKLMTEQYCRRFGIKTPESESYDVADLEIAKKNAFNHSDKSVVIKPLDSSFGRGVRVNVTKNRFDYNWGKASEALKKNKRKILVQDYIEGFECRVTVVEGEFASAVVRIPPYIQGDGSSSISDLIEAKNMDRNKCGFLKRMPIERNERINEYLKSSNRSFKTIPDKDELVLLNSVSNIAHGGETMDITDFVSNSVKELALNTTAAIPGLYTAGLDIMIKSFDDEFPVLLEVNTYPVLSIPTIPTYGNGTDVTKIYFESMISLDQYLNEPKNPYEIPDYDEYLKKYMKFFHRRKQLITQYGQNLEDIYGI